MPKLTNNNFNFDSFEDDWKMDLIDLAGDEFDEERKVMQALEELDEEENEEWNFFF